jgi:succinyl-CoA synthetase alpha subunit
VLEAVDAGVELIVAITEHVPVHDVLKMKRQAEIAGAWLIGPNTPGIISPGIGKLGIMPGNLFKPGRIGIISRSGTLSYEIAGVLNEAGFGQSTMVGMGGDPVVGTGMAKILSEFEADEHTDAVVIIGEIGGSAEEEAASYIREMTKPVVAYLAGRTAPAGRRMGHAGAITGKGGFGTVESKAAAFKSAGTPVAGRPSEVPGLLQALTGR